MRTAIDVTLLSSALRVPAEAVQALEHGLKDGSEAMYFFIYPVGGVSGGPAASSNCNKAYHVGHAIAKTMREHGVTSVRLVT